MKKEKVNRIRATISLTIGIMGMIIALGGFVGMFIAIFLGSPELADGLDLLAFYFCIIFGPIFFIVEFCGNKKYGPIRYSSEYRIPTKISYKSDITERLITYLKNNKYKNNFLIFHICLFQYPYRITQRNKTFPSIQRSAIRWIYRGIVCNKILNRKTQI